MIFSRDRLTFLDRKYLKSGSHRWKNILMASDSNLVVVAVRIAEKFDFDIISSRLKEIKKLIRSESKGSIYRPQYRFPHLHGSRLTYADWY